MVLPRLLRQSNGSAVVFLSVGIVPLLIALGLILAAPHSALAAPCDPQISGFGPTSSPDTVDALHNNGVYGGVASSAPTPSGYVVFDNNGNIPFGAFGTWSAAHMPNANYLGWRNLQSYDPSNCSALCNVTSTCRSFNMFYQRSPTLEPSWNASSSCYNPPSTVEIMCTLWNTNITVSAIEVNFGWARGGFNVAIVASKFYNKKGTS
ncbi:hypothetical protein J7T55_003613 [Diaporthe amygdali]|uniref:uncharacterized protein n=1 Tax=Phomopsis amygdali TaxID=1214568 RepID=UPI0022FF2C90|nr:uncharacterized protein J7T55_003613 [Diaporthe amygdali]KAJ0117196.1 hypothetical protein J7T55_003613 [Diaporthe amygdali]